MTKINFLLITSIAVIFGSFGLEAAKSETLQSVEITREASVRVGASCGCSQMPTTNLSEDQFFKLKAQWVNDDKIGDLAIMRFGCDCSGCRIAIATAQMNSQNLQPF